MQRLEGATSKRALMTQRLADLGVDDTVAVDPAHTIRPDALTMQSERRLPLLSVDFGGDAVGGAADSSLEVRGILGEGGMGRVYLAREHALDREVAVKTAKPGAGDAVRRAILEEGRITGHLEHPAIVPVHALGVDASGNPAMVMKRVEGVAWDVLIADADHVGWEGWGDDRLEGHLRILMIVCNAVHYANSRGYVHRDIKPENVLIGAFGDVYLADWGVAGRVGHTDGALRGTPGFMAPEMALGLQVDARTDVYLLGSTLHFVLTGAPLHDGKTLGDLVWSAAASVPAEYGDDVPAELCEVLHRACARDHAERYATAAELRDALRDFLRHRDSRALTDGAHARVERVLAIMDLSEPTEDDRAELEEAIAQASFGIEQALSVWPENAAALESKRQLDDVVQARRDRRAELERQDRERNPDVGASVRTRMMLLVLVASFLAAGLLLIVEVAPGPMGLFAIPMWIGALMGLATWVSRRSLLSTAFNRQAVSIVFIATGTVVLGRGVGLFQEVPLHEHLARDSFVMGAVLLVAMVTLVRWALWPAIVSLASAVLTMVYPERALTLFVSGMMIVSVLVVGFLWRDSRRADQR